VKNENGNLLVDSHNMLNKCNKYSIKLLNVHRVSDLRHVEIHTAEPLVLGPRTLKLKLLLQS
jgi:hypothetical protein